MQTPFTKHDKWKYFPEDQTVCWRAPYGWETVLDLSNSHLPELKRHQLGRMLEGFPQLWFAERKR